MTYQQWLANVWVTVGMAINLDRVDKTQFDLTPAFERGEGRLEVAAQVIDKLIDQQMKKALPYPWCYQPEVCGPKGYCTKDPSCGD